MATRQYIGARYVPKFYVNGSGTSEWTANTAYEALTIVTRNGNSYTSKIPVPASVGAPENNAAYWVSTGIYNQQVEAYRQEVVGYRDDVADFESNLSDYGQIEIIGCVLRKDENGWGILDNSGHKPLHITGVSVRADGGIDLNYDKTYSKVGSLCIVPDETLTRCGWGAGASVAVGGSTIVLSHTRAYSGMFDFNEQGEISYYPDPSYLGDIREVVWDGTVFQVRFKEYVKGGFFNSVFVQFSRGAYNKIAVPTTNFSDDYRINITPGPDGLSGVGTRGGMYIMATKGGYEVDANDFPVITNANFFISGFMWK